MNQYQDIDYTLAKMLLKRVKEKKERSPHITYGECADQLTAIHRKVQHFHGWLWNASEEGNQSVQSGVEFGIKVFVHGSFSFLIFGARTLYRKGYYKSFAEGRPSDSFRKGSDRLRWALLNGTAKG